MLLSVVCFIAVVVVDGWMENYAYCTFYNTCCLFTVNTHSTYIVPVSTRGVYFLQKVLKMTWL
jgi:hypothetical protein